MNGKSGVVVFLFQHMSMLAGGFRGTKFEYIDAAEIMSFSDLIRMWAFSRFLIIQSSRSAL